ncbi:hypothetical protein MTY66_60760 (plasmid) [Mycolicibacterium sp. TY66]|jgi:hypothetical protein|uniref:hypothetical protein n=1 Tax=unclassified Mycolicibacterium TaxID=2636767 RepID=UPI001BB3BF76|nr:MULTISPECIES: hypothetical protein [unclassified Mycolicibacterium]BCI84451.1 hypothetical protein MTY66_60760 [Mycolicibacterium sp. TY66]BCJ84683.1 hypothetical protein MTY81_60560 [Mycolicibacterium sp. TY81]
MARDLLADVIAEALAASLKGDEPNWPTRRNWDADEAKAITLHANAIASAVRQAPGIVVATLTQDGKPGTIAVTTGADPDELRQWADRHTAAGHRVAAHTLYEAALAAMQEVLTAVRVRHG